MDPHIVSPRNIDESSVQGLLCYLDDNLDAIKDKLLSSGVVILRGFELLDPNDFKTCIIKCGLGEIYNYDKCSVPRTIIIPNIYTSINLSGDIKVPPHNEKSYHYDSPDYIFFNCIKPAALGGETILVDSRVVWRSIPDKLRKKLTNRKIKYKRFYYNKNFVQKFLEKISKKIIGKTWSKAFYNDNKEGVTNHLKREGYKLSWSLLGLKTYIKLPAQRKHPLSGEEVWFNNIAHRNIYFNSIKDILNKVIKNKFLNFVLGSRFNLNYVASYGDGSKISKKDASVILNIIQKNTIKITLCPGDFVIIDNYLCMHGKLPHAGDRLMMVGMTKMKHEDKVYGS